MCPRCGRRRVRRGPGREDAFYVAAEVTDPQLKRSSKNIDGDDHMALVLAFPSGRGVLKAYEIGFWPGNPGAWPGAVKWTNGANAGQKVNGAKIVENDGK